MNDIWTFLITILINIIHIKTLSQEHIKLDRNHRILFAIYILSLNIKLRAIESSLAGFLCIFQTDVIQNLTHCALNAVPLCRVTKIFVRIFRIPLRHTICYIFL